MRPSTFAIIVLAAAAVATCDSQLYVNKAGLTIVTPDETDQLDAAIHRCAVLGVSNRLGVACAYDGTQAAPAFTMERYEREVTLDEFEAVMVSVVDPLCADRLVLVRVIDRLSPTVFRSYGVTCDHGVVANATGIETVYSE